MFLQLVGKRYTLKAVRILIRKRGNKNKKETVLFRENLLGSIIKTLLVSDSILYARCNQSHGKALKTGAYYHSEYSKTKMYVYIHIHTYINMRVREIATCGCLHLKKVRV